MIFHKGGNGNKNDFQENIHPGTSLVLFILNISISLLLLKLLFNLTCFSHYLFKSFVKSNSIKLINFIQLEYIVKT